MVIRKMNTVLVKHNRILLGVLLVIIIVSFVWFFTPGLDGSVFFGDANSSPNAVVGTVFGRKITNKQYQQAFRDRMLVLEAMTGADSYQLQRYIEDTLFRELARETAAEIMGISATDEEVANFIRNACALFRGKNGFDPERYLQFSKAIQEREGRSIAEFENLVRRMLSADKMIAEMTSGAYLTADEKERMAVLLKEKFNARLIEFPFSAYKKIKRGSAEAKQKGLGDSDMLNYYKANQKSFMTEPQMKAVAVVFPFIPVNYAPSAAEIKKYYDAHKQDFLKDGKEQPLAQVRGKIAEAIRKEKAVEGAMRRAKKFREELYTASESVETAAGQITQLKKLAAKQKLNLVQTGWFTARSGEIKGLGKEPELVAALFRTNPKHNPLLTASHKGKSGVYVAGSVALMPSAPADFKDVQGKVWDLMLADYAKRMAMEAANNFAHQVATRRNAGKELKDLAQKAGARLSELKGFSRETAINMPTQIAVRLADQTLLQPQQTNDGVILVYLDGRVRPTDAEKAAAAKMMEPLLQYSKQKMQQESFGFWIDSNSPNRLARDRAN